ncbi:patatin family protein [Shewanella sp. 1_MG-2023]|uniref:patatin-like phospholipase family protein n=1 Tax=unclassified Shewanella TaxID=196818 RepID=UPI0026E3F17B|nr:MULTISPECIES: patatin family protein [unclassified Shewanella]MDO6611298.1 patatin family protein [Shewanella sp. 7_MG-2023]MDO6771153.1 patatin family protein [Shewanella sp. 2_MG-2023]MDO6795834.1 patatin family protein [Shewanella sp. 1_MG-2023]
MKPVNTRMDTNLLQPSPPPHALIVEGGAMRGIFASGVLDRFIDLNHRPFDFCIGVSAGSTNLASWLSNQKQRNYRIITHYSCLPEFIDLKRFIKGGHWLDLNWLWDILAKECHFDMDTFSQQPVPLFVVTTDITTGKAVYIKSNADNIEHILKASCSVPIAFRDFPAYQGSPMTDGGIADSIPIIKAYEMGAKEITVVLSRPLGYRKKSPKLPWLIKRALKAHPQLANAMVNRANSYNNAIDFIQSPPLDCKINVIAPPAEFNVGRLTTDKAILESGYQMGIDAANLTVDNS